MQRNFHFFADKATRFQNASSQLQATIRMEHVSVLDGFIWLGWLREQIGAS